ncbi:MAG TPA: glycosyltransferase family 2 protein [Candidatus Saccharimonadales bacterium]|nr:glycosyltransferase family 2 protein [Candidatus Saccharimonadales bacterium]
MGITLFFCCAFLLLYSPLLYPLILWLLAVLFGRESRSDGSFTPQVSVLIPAYDEEAVIARKLENTLALDYPRERLEILVASESDDATDDIVRGFAGRGVRLLPSAVRRGKVANLGRAVPESRGEILLLTDANAMIRPEALRRIVRHFADPRIGSVSGRLTYVNPGGGAAGASERLYWGMEQIVKKASSRLFSLPGANGSVFAVRKSAYRPIAEDRGDDFEIPIRCVIDGLGSILEPDAISVEEAAGGFVQEYRRKVRIIHWMLRSALILLGEALGRRRWLLAFQLLSHKINRWAMPFWLLGLFAASVTLAGRGGFFRAAAVAQAAAYGASLLLLAIDRTIRPLRGLLGAPVYFLVVNAASFVGIVSCLARREVTWHKTR